MYRDELLAMPVHQVYVSGFAIDRDEVTVADYRACVIAGACALDPLVSGDERYIHDEWPLVNVTWKEADEFCRWRGGRLPTEAEWELAAAGTPDDLAWYEAPAPATLPAVGGAPDARGISDLHGLVWEWVEDFGASGVGVAQCGAATPAEPVASTIYLRYAFRTSLDATFAIGSLGFRCAYDEVKP
jgi:formylglycine-generating enzyme required for sulfatase activity